MYKCWITFFFLLFCLNTFGQSRVADSLKVFNELDSVFKVECENDLIYAIRITERQDSIANFLNLDSLKVITAMNSALITRRLGSVAVAMEDLLAALRLAERGTNKRLISKVNYELAILYQTQLRDYANAEKHLKAAYSVAVANGFYNDTTFYNYGIAENLVFRDKAKEGIRLLKDNIEQAKKTDKYVMIMGGLETLAFVYFGIGEKQKSIECLYEILPYLPKINTNYHWLVGYLHVAELSTEFGRWDTAAKYLDLALHYAPLLNSPDWYYECYKVQSRVYAHMGKYKEALAAEKLFGIYKDSVSQKDYHNKMAVQTAKYGLEKKQSEISMLQKDNALKAIKAKQQKLQLNIIILFSTLVIVLLIAFFRGWMSRRTKKLQIMFSRMLLKNQEADKQRIAHELHDSIGQNILFIKNQVSAQPDDSRKAKVLEAITATIEDIRDISKELYPNQLDKYGLAAAVNTLADKTMEAIGIFMSASLDEIDAVLNKEAKINCYRIIQECTTNTVKYANAKAIRIEGTLKKEKVLLVISDNGQGFDTSVLANKAQSSFGLVGIEERAKILGGKMDIDTSPGGTRITITFPISGYEV